jgi:hypothetical protein
LREHFSRDVLPLVEHEASFNLGFGVADPDDIVLEISPGFEYDNAIFTS